MMRHLSRTGDRCLEHATRVGLRPVQRRTVRREADAIWRVRGVHHLANQRTIGGCVVDRRDVCLTTETDAVIGEVEPAVAIEYEISRSSKRHTVAMRVQIAQLPRREIEALNASADVLIRIHRSWEREPEEIHLAERSSVVADVQRAIGAKSEPYATLTRAEPAGDVAWNFEKFLIGRDGTVLARFKSSVEPDSAELTGAIEAALAA